MTGYFIGLTLGAGAVVFWTRRYGRVSLKSLGVWWHDLAERNRKSDETAFSTRRDRVAATQLVE